MIIRPDGYRIPENATSVHGITTEMALSEGLPLEVAISEFSGSLEKCHVLVGHNLPFDLGVVAAECVRLDLKVPFSDICQVCTMRASVRVCKIRRNGRYKMPTLNELHTFLFGVGVEGAHNALNDAEACARCFFELKRRGLIKNL